MSCIPSLQSGSSFVQYCSRKMNTCLVITSNSIVSRTRQKQEVDNDFKKHEDSTYMPGNLSETVH